MKKKKKTRPSVAQSNLILNFNCGDKGAICTITAPNVNLHSEYAISEESMMAIYEVLGNIINLTEPYIGNRLIMDTEGE